MDGLVNHEDFKQIVNHDCNAFLKHIASKQKALELSLCHTDSLMQQIDKHEGGVSISGRISDYFKNLKPKEPEEIKLKETLTDSGLSELASLGSNTNYVLKEVHDICPEIAKAAKVQIGGGIALLAAGCCFPPALPVTSAIGSTMISEGISDIAIELINTNSDGKFNKEAYIKGKVISYCMSILTMGIKAALECPRILNAAKKACRWISITLRKCPFFKTACELLATKFDKLANYFQKLETLAMFNKMSKFEKVKYVESLEKAKDMKFEYLKNLAELEEMQKLHNLGKLKEMSHFEKCFSTIKHVAASNIAGVTDTVVKNQIMNKIAIPLITSSLNGLEKVIRKHVAASVRDNIEQEKLKFVSNLDFLEIVKDIRDSIDSGTIPNISKVLGMAKHCSSWQIQLGALAIDQIVSWGELINYVHNICIKINDRIKSTTNAINQNVTELLDQFIDQITEEVYGKFVVTLIKTCKDVYSVGRSAYKNYEKQEKEVQKCLEDTRKIHDESQNANWEGHQATEGHEKWPGNGDPEKKNPPQQKVEIYMSSTEISRHTSLTVHIATSGVVDKTEVLTKGITIVLENSNDNLTF